MLDLPILAKERTIAGPGFNRWLVPPAALAIHLCIGMSYGFSVFWGPMTKMLGGNGVMACDANLDLIPMLTATDCNWLNDNVVWTFKLFFVALGLAAALWGGWLEHVGPRKAGVIAALCWAGGLALMAVGVNVHQLWLIWGGGLVGGVGLGLGYISPVSTLIKWFPDRRGMATGMAIMGFGGGALVGSPLAVMLMKHFKDSSTTLGVSETLFSLAVIYLIFMLAGAFGYRVPATGWKPEGWTPPVKQTENKMITGRHVQVNRAMFTPQFWLIWLVLMLNVAAGIGVLAMASPMLQEVFGGQLIGVPKAIDELSKTDRDAIAKIAGGLVALIALFNSGGRFLWASISDIIGRKSTYFVFFVLGMILYASCPSIAHAGYRGLFVISLCIILTMYGGGFATVPAYLADMFGTQMVGAIHGRLLTAWSVAAVVGPTLFTKLRESELKSGIAKALVYDEIFYILVGLLAVGFLCNLLIRPVADKHFMTPEQLEKEKQLAHERDISNMAGEAGAGATGATHPIVVVLAWLAVLIPICYGVSASIQASASLFN